jgi:2-polyprenyl-3-methyl-5-hydroxy-6-metoxy-1,4-benzoquinol methylase
VSSLQDISGYTYTNAELGCAHTYLLPKVAEILAHQFEVRSVRHRLFDLGCGNGSVAAHFSRLGYEVTGVDPSTDGVAAAHAKYPHLEVNQGSAYDNLAATYGTYPAVISLEVVEHVYSPRSFARTAFNLLESGGIAVISTPYHGYLKNIAIAVMNSFDKHFNPLWDHGHIKFWSIRTLTTLLQEAGFGEIRFYRVGRVPMFAKSMIAVATKP